MAAAVAAVAAEEGEAAHQGVCRGTTTEATSADTIAATIGTTIAMMTGSTDHTGRWFCVRLSLVIGGLIELFLFVQ